jgi:GT2 family glycosyltransferase
MNTLPVVAAIPNYNMAAELKVLLPQLIKEDYTDIFVLDDASTDDSKAIVESFGPRVTFVGGAVNLGAGGNRNRVIKALNYDAFIHFLDADTELETKNIVSIIQQASPRGDFGFVGGLVKTKLGMPLVWNYGTRPGFKSDIAAIRQYQFECLLAVDLAKAKAFHSRHAKLLQHWPNPLVDSRKIETYWCSEANMVIRSSTFATFNGFDETIRETEISDFSVRLHRAGLRSYFDPSFIVRHTEAEVRTYNRRSVKDRERWQLARRYGIRNWLPSSDRYS